MNDFLTKIIPNVVAKSEAFWKSVGETFIMVGWSGAISFVLGLVLGIVLVVTRRGGILQNKIAFQVTDKIVNLFRSIPFIILLTFVMPLSRLLMGTAIGVRGAIVPLVFGCTPFFARQVETALSEVDSGLVEASLSMGLSPLDIIFRVYLRESIAPLARGTTITIISLIGLTAMAGAVGAGGLGDFAIRYGHDRNQTDVTYVTVILLVLIVSAIQLLGAKIAKKK